MTTPISAERRKCIMSMAREAIEHEGAPAAVYAVIAEVPHLINALESAEQEREAAESYAEKFEGDYYTAMGKYERVSEALKKAEQERDTAVRERDLLAEVLGNLDCPDNILDYSEFLALPEHQQWCALKWDAQGEPLGCEVTDVRQCWKNYAASEAAKEKGE